MASIRSNGGRECNVVFPTTNFYPFADVSGQDHGARRPGSLNRRLLILQTAGLPVAA
jgi:hypothetical protein